MNQQDWKKAWDCLNPDAAAKQRMQLAIQKKLEEEKKEVKQQHTICSFSVFIRKVALCCAAMAITVSGLQIAHMEQKQWIMEPVVLSDAEKTPASLYTTTSAETHTTMLDTTTSSLKGETTTYHRQSTVTTTKTIAVTSEIKAAEMAWEPSETEEWEVPVQETTQAKETFPLETEPIVTTPIVTTSLQPVETTAMETQVSTEESVETTETTAFRGNTLYGSLFDFSYARWNGVYYQTNYETVAYESLGELEGFSVARKETSSDVYTIAVYSMKDDALENCIAVQYVGDTDYFYFYAVS